MSNWLTDFTDYSDDEQAIFDPERGEIVIPKGTRRYLDDPDPNQPEVIAARRRAAWKRFLKRRGHRYASCTMDNYETPAPAQKAVLGDVRAYGEDILGRLKVGQNLILFGPSGTGKDHLAAAIARVAILEHGLMVAWASGALFFTGLRAAMDNRNLCEERIVEYLTRPDLLLLSDPVPPAGVLTDYQRSMLYRVVDERYNSMRPIVLTINVLSSGEADERLGAPIVDRLKDGALTLFCSWLSHRKAATPSRNGGPSE